MSAVPFSHAAVIQAFPELSIREPELGIGSYKVAYEGYEDGQSVVLKILLEPTPEDIDTLDSDELPERFARELSGMARVDSDHVVKLLRRPELRVIGNRGYMWYLEPYYSGGTLAQRLAQGRFGRTLGIQILTSMLQAVSDMWLQAGVVHRDIKPGNIVFDDTGKPILLDLGIAFHRDLTTITDAYGPSPRTPRYAAPEQFEMRRIATIDFRTDLFLVGMVAYETLTGQHPFWDPKIDISEYHRRVDAGSFDKMRLSEVSKSHELDRIIARLLAPRPSGRYRDVSEPLLAASEVAL